MTTGISGSGPAAGWKAALHLLLEPGTGRTRVRRNGGYGPLYLQKPFYPEDDLAHLYLLHPPGGFVGGDRLEIGISTRPGAAALVTTPAAGKFYRSTGGFVDVEQRLGVAPGSSLEWLPQESIFFSGALARISTAVQVSPSGRFIGWEISTLGRPASGDHFSAGQVTSGFSVRRTATGDDRPGIPLLIEQNRWSAGDPLLTAAWGLAGYPVSGLLVALPADQDVLQRVRGNVVALKPEAEGIGALTLVDEILVARVLAVHNEVARRWLEQVWALVRPCVLGRPACPPRIWRT
jgi:urease accessory protein